MEFNFLSAAGNEAALELSTTEQESGKDGMTVKFVTLEATADAERASSGNVDEKNGAEPRNVEEPRKTGQNLLQKSSPTFSEVTQQEDEQSEPDKESALLMLTPALEEGVYHKVPTVLKKIVDLFGYDEPDTKTMLLLGQLAVLSSVMPNVRCLLRDENCYPNMGLVVSGSSSAGKSGLLICRHLVNGIDDRISAQGGVPLPNDSLSMRALIYPSDMSNAAFNKMLDDNQGRGLIIESEMKTIISALRNADWGLKREMLLKVFEHEEISVARADGRFFKISEPKLSMALSGVENDVLDFLGTDGVGSGLVSRMLFYTLKQKQMKWRSLAGSGGSRKTAKELLEEEIAMVEQMYAILEKRQTVLTLNLSDEQLARIDQWAAPKFYDQSLRIILGDDVVSVIKRYPMHIMRLAVVLSVLRYMERGYQEQLLNSPELPIEDLDLDIALEIASMLFLHAQYMFIAATDPKAQQRTQQRQGVIRVRAKDLKGRRDQQFSLFMTIYYPYGFTRQEHKKEGRIELDYSLDYLDDMFRHDLKTGKIVPVEGKTDLYRYAKK